jgi:hypothetical protein
VSGLIVYSFKSINIIERMIDFKDLLSVKSYFGHKIRHLLIYSSEINFNFISFHDLLSLKSIELLFYERNETQFYIEII